MKNQRSSMSSSSFTTVMLVKSQGTDVHFDVKVVDGRSFTLVFTGSGNGRNNDSMNTVRGTFQTRLPR